MPSNNVNWPAIFDFTIFSKSQQIMINTKSSQNADEMYEFMNFRNLMKKTGNKLQNHLKKSWNLEFDGCRGNIKNDGHTIDISKFPQRMMEQLVKVSAP